MQTCPVYEVSENVALSLVGEKATSCCRVTIQNLQRRGEVVFGIGEHYRTSLQSTFVSLAEGNVAAECIFLWRTMLLREGGVCCMYPCGGQHVNPASPERQRGGGRECLEPLNLGGSKVRAVRRS